MKGSRTILERRVFEVLSDLCADLQNAKISYCIIGGLGVQMHLAHLYGNKGQLPVNKCMGLEPLLRGTGDLDIIIQSEENPVSVFFNQFTLHHPSYKVFNGPRYALAEGLTINYISTPQELKGPTGAYQQALEHPQQIRLRFGNRESIFFVQPIEYFIAAKLSGNRVFGKDRWDIRALLKAAGDHRVPLNYEIVESVLKNTGKKERLRILQELQEQTQTQRS